MLCPKCSGINDNSAAFCQSCGTNLKFDQAAGFQQTAAPISQVEYAGFWRRFVAYFIDFIILFIILTIFGGILSQIRLTYITPHSYTNHTNFFLQLAILILINFLMIAILFIYYAAMESSQYQATIGKMAMGIIVTDLNGNKISFSRATGRNLAKIISGIILNIGFILVGFTEKKQGLHDMIAGCLVIMKNKS